MIVLAGVPYDTMADSVTEQALERLTDHWGNPFDAFAGYDNGSFADFADIARHFPNAHLLDFTVWLANIATGGDVEPGDMTPQQGAEWARERIAAGVWRPVLYGGCGDLKTAVLLLSGMGIDRSQVRLVSAHYWEDGHGGYVPHICGLSSCGLTDLDLDGTQWAGWGNVPNHSNYDESLLVAGFFGVPPPPPTQEELEMQAAVDGKTGIAFATDAEGNFYGDGAVPHVVTLADIRAKYGGAAGTMFEPCVGILSEKDANGEWGYTYICKPGTPDKGSRLGPFSAFHVNRDGTF